MVVVKVSRSPTRRSICAMNGGREWRKKQIIFLRTLPTTRSCGDTMRKRIATPRGMKRKFILVERSSTKTRNTLSHTFGRRCCGRPTTSATRRVIVVTERMPAFNLWRESVVTNWRLHARSSSVMHHRCIPFILTNSRWI